MIAIHPRNCGGKFIENTASRHYCRICTKKLEIHYRPSTIPCLRCNKPKYRIYWQCPAQIGFWGHIWAFLTDQQHTYLEGESVHI